jgi:hypothetical protein
MKSPVRAAATAAAIAGAGMAGFGLTGALAQEGTSGDPSTTTEAPADDAGRPGGPGCAGASPDALAEAIGIEVEELRTALAEGQTPAEVAEANGVSRAELIDVIVADIEAHLDEAVEAGRLTEAEADERRAEAEDQAGAIADGERPDGLGPPGPRPRGEDEAEATAPAAA